MRDSKWKIGPATRHIKVLDTTLRDGQQCPGAGMSLEENLEYARLSSQLGVDVIEAGFPSASAIDFEIVHTIAAELAQLDDFPTVAALCQLRSEQFEKTIQSLQPLIARQKARLHTYVPVDPHLLPASLGTLAANKNKICSDVFRLIRQAVVAGVEVQFSPEGYSRMQENFDFTTDLIRAAVDAGANVINCPDTIGGASIYQGREYFVEKMKEHWQIIASEFPHRNITWSVHCHNDFGLAVANTINAVFNGPARQIEGCINGIGERAGNAAIEQCVMIIKCFGGQADLEHPFFTTVVSERLQAVSDFVSKNMLPRQPHWPISGDNAARHSSGGHTNAILRNPHVYQPFDPQETGKTISLLFGPLSGGNHAQALIRKFNYLCHDDEKSQIAQFIKDRHATRRKGITDEELLETYLQYRAPFSVETVDYSKAGERSQVTLHGTFFGKRGSVSECNEGRDSALAAVKKIIEKMLGNWQVIAHKSHSSGSGHKAESISRIILANGQGRKFEGQGADRDIEISAIRALIDAANRCYVYEHFGVQGSAGGNSQPEKHEDNAPFVA